MNDENRDTLLKQIDASVRLRSISHASASLLIGIVERIVAIESARAEVSQPADLSAAKARHAVAAKERARTRETVVAMVPPSAELPTPSTTEDDAAFDEAVNAAPGTITPKVLVSALGSLFESCVLAVEMLGKGESDDEVSGQCDMSLPRVVALRKATVVASADWRQRAETAERELRKARSNPSNDPPLGNHPAPSAPQLCIRCGSAEEADAAGDGDVSGQPSCPGCYEDYCHSVDDDGGGTFPEWAARNPVAAPSAEERPAGDELGKVAHDAWAGAPPACDSSWEHADKPAFQAAASAVERIVVARVRASIAADVEFAIETVGAAGLEDAFDGLVKTLLAGPFDLETLDGARDARKAAEARVRDEERLRAREGLARLRFVLTNKTAGRVSADVVLAAVDAELAAIDAAVKKEAANGR